MGEEKLLLVVGQLARAWQSTAKKSLEITRIMPPHHE